MSLKQQVFSAGRWTAASTAFATVLQLLQTIILARLLVPADFGLMAVVAALLAAVAMVADFGLSRALIHFDSLSPGHLSSLYWLNLALSGTLTLVMFAAAPALGLLYDSTALVPVLQGASLVFPLTALGQQFRVLAEKNLRFGAVVRNEIAAGLVGFAAAIGVALLGGGVYALVVGMLASAAASSGLAWLVLSSGYRPSFQLHTDGLRQYLAYGAYMLGENFASTLQRQSDIFVGGAVVGPAAMGIYSIPRDQNLRLGNNINQVITRVGFPAMAGIRRDRVRLKLVYLATLRMTASVNFPFYAVLALYADEVVLLLYGPQWRGAGLYMRVFALWGLVRSIGQPIGSLLYAVGMARRALSWNLALLLLLPPAYWWAANGGQLIWLAWSMLAAQILLVLPAWRLLVRPACGAGLGEFLLQPAMPLLLTAIAAVISMAVTANVHGAGWRIAVGGTAGAVSYLALSFAFNRPWIDAMIGAMRMSGRST